MSHPKTQQTGERRKRYAICMSKSEHKHIRRLAREAGLPLSNYVRARIVYGNAHWEIEAKVKQGVKF